MPRRGRPRGVKYGQRARPRGLVVRRKSMRPMPPMPSAVRCVLVAIDSALTSGIAVYVNGKLYDYGEVRARCAAKREAVLVDALLLARNHGLPCMLVIEVPYGGYQTAVLSLTLTAGLWVDTWQRMGGNPEHCIQHTAGEWRRMLFGSRSMPRIQARAMEARLAAQIVAKDGTDVSRRVGPDAAAAICIGQTLIRSREVYLLLARSTV